MIYKILPDINVQPAWLYSNLSKISNLYEPFVEKIFQPPFAIPGYEARAIVQHGVTVSNSIHNISGRRAKIREMVEVYRHGSTFDLGEQYIYDARWKFNKNIAHLIHHHLTRLGFFKKTIGIDAGDIKVILNAEKNSLAENIFNNFGYEVVRTDRKVAGNIVVFSGGEFFNILEYIENLKFCGVVGNMPENIYIPRKSTRKIKNSDDVSSLMRERGYVELFFEDLSIAEQWSAMKNARNIVAIHGAALGWLAFSCRRPDGIKANLIELFPAGFVVNPYRKYMAALGGAWAGCRGQITKEVVMDLDFGGELKSRAFDDFYISPESIEAALDQVKG